VSYKKLGNYCGAHTSKRMFFEDGPKASAAALLYYVIKFMVFVYVTYWCNFYTGFYFSKDEPTALVQTEGGPCAVLAPVQAFILKSLLSKTVGNNWREVRTKHWVLYILRRYLHGMSTQSLYSLKVVCPWWCKNVCICIYLFPKIPYTGMYTMDVGIVNKLAH